MFIVFEGLDGAGKTTQAKLLRDRLQAEGLQVELVADPGTTALGQSVRQILLQSDAPITPVAQMLLFSAARAELAAYIKTRLAAGYTILCDRWLVSTLVYQGVINDIDQRLILDIFNASAGLKPDLCVHLAIDVDTALERVGPKRDRYESSSIEDWRLKHEAYNNFCHARIAGKRCETLNAQQTPEQVHADVYALYVDSVGSVI